MERCTHAAILLFVFGIIEVYSFPQGGDLTATAVSRKIFEDDPHYDSSSQVIILEHESAGRIRRDGGGTFKEPPKSDKETRVLDLARRTREEESRQEAIRERVRAHQAAEARFEAILDRYISEGLTRPAAIDRIRKRHPALANQFLPSTTPAPL